MFVVIRPQNLKYALTQSDVKRYFLSRFYILKLWILLYCPKFAIDVTQT